MNFQNNIDNFLNKLKDYVYTMDSIDRVWNIIFPDHRNKYHYIRVTKYHEVFYLFSIDGDLPTLEIKPKISVVIESTFDSVSSRQKYHDPALAWDQLITDAHKWLSYVAKDWIKANRNVYENYPLNKRTGIVPNSLIRASLSDVYRIDTELGKDKMKKFIHILESGYFNNTKNVSLETMTANDYFNYCKIAYIAGQRKDDDVDEKLSGREMYARYADGRHDGLLDIDEQSAQEFSDWLDKGSMGGHPWEIKRGGNTTHISLHVTRPSPYIKEGYKITLKGASIGRLKETICMFLAMYEAKLPINISNHEAIGKRLLALDNIGIVPSYQSLHRANQNYSEEQNVFDVLHYDDLGKYKRRINPFICWKPLPIFKPA